MKRNITMKDIADVLDISVVSVSKALNNKEGISIDLRKKILQTADDLGYKTKVPFKVSDEDLTIGVIIPNYFITLEPSFYWSVYEKLVKSLKQQGYYCFLEIIDPSAKNSLPSFLKTKKANGIIVVGYVPPDYLTEIDKCNIPLIMLDFYNENVKGISIMPDNSISSYKITSHLIEQGHRAIGFVGNILATTTIMDRYLGYYKALLEHGIPLNEKWVIPDRGNDMAIFREYKLPKEMPTAFVCNCDQTGYWFVEYLTQQGYKVPEDISITGFYNYSYARVCKPPLTTVDVPMDSLADLSVNALLDMIKNKSNKSDIILVYGNILKRDSVKKL